MSHFAFKTYYRRHLPHIQPPGATMFITFRLANSIPMQVLRQLEQEQQENERALSKISDPHERAKEAEIQERKFFGKWDHHLDSSANEPYWLREPDIAQLVSNSLHYQHTKRYTLEAFCIMPNHVHLVCTPLKQTEDTYYPIATIMHPLKRHTAFHANKLLKRIGDFWHHENYDHYARNEAEFGRIVNYVLNNPVTAGLVSNPKDWQWSFSGTNL